MLVLPSSLTCTPHPLTYTLPNSSPPSHSLLLPHYHCHNSHTLPYSHTLTFAYPSHSHPHNSPCHTPSPTPTYTISLTHSTSHPLTYSHTPILTLHLHNHTTEGIDTPGLAQLLVLRVNRHGICDGCWVAIDPVYILRTGICNECVDYTCTCVCTVYMGNVGTGIEGASI